ncbi:MAG: oligosaccharide flippase family protein [Pseudomonadota bacterium]
MSDTASPSNAQQSQEPSTAYWRAIDQRFARSKTLPRQLIGRLQRFWQAFKRPEGDRTLEEKLAIGSALTTFEYVLTIFFRIGSTLIVTRLLAPEVFGLFAVIVTFQVIASMLSDLGVRQLIIVSDHTDDPTFLQTCWTVQIIRGLVLWGSVICIALLLWVLHLSDVIGGGTVYASPVLPFALALSGAQLALQGAESVNQHVDVKFMRFRRITVLNCIRAALAPVLTIAIALHHPSVWSLVVAGFLGSALSLVLTFVLFPGCPMRFCWERRYANELFARGKWIVGQSGLTVIAKSADKIVLGAVLPAPMLGIYFLATQIIEVPHNLLHRLQAALGLQFFQRTFEEAKDPTAIRSRYYRYRVPFDLIACLLTGGMISAAPAVIDLMYDPRYQQAGPMLQILALGLPLATVGLIREAFSAQKRFRTLAFISAIQAISIWLGLFVAMPVLGGMTGALLVIALHRLPEIATLWFLAQRSGWVGIFNEIRFAPLILVGALMGWGMTQLFGFIDL